MKAADVSAIATGATWVGNDAKAAGLVDEIEKSRVKQKETAMDIEKLKAELAAALAANGTMSASVQELTAKLEAALKLVADLQAKEKEAHATHRALILAKYEAHAAPADLATIQQYGEFCGHDIAKFEAFLKSRTPVTRPTRMSDPGPKQEGDPVAELTPAMLAVAKQMNNSADDLRKHGGLQVVA
jgi:roadblock/LC7 domain-containing protein